MTDLVPGIRAGDVMLHAAPIAHASGAFVLPHLVSGATQVILPAFDAAATVALHGPASPAANVPRADDDLDGARRAQRRATSTAR